MHQPPGHSGHDERHELQLLDYWRILVRRRLVLLSCLALTVVVTMTLTFLTAPRYQASTTLEIERKSPEVVEFTDVVSVDTAGYWDFQQTQIKILQSRTVARLAAERLDLANRPEFAGRKGSPLGRFLAWGRSLGSSAPRAGVAGLDTATAYVQASLSIAAVRNSNLVVISARDRDPLLAADVANAAAAAYQAFQHDSRYSTTGAAREFLTKDVARAQAEISTLERTLQAYGAEKEILALSDRTQNIGEQALADINRRCIEAQGRLAATEARLVSIQDAPPEALPQVLNSPTVANLRARYSQLELEHGQMVGRFRPGWPARVQLEGELNTARTQLHSESENIANHVRAAARADFETARAELRTLEKHREEQKREIQRISRDAVDYAGLKTEIDTKRTVLADLVTRQSQTDTTYRLKDASTSNIRVVDRAETPRDPISPNKRLNLLLSLIFGLGLGAMLALLVDHLDNTVKTEQDIQRISKLTVLGHVPLTRTLGPVVEEAAGGMTPQLDMASHVHPRSNLSEAFRNLRTSLLLAAPDRPPRHILVTSCEPADGKSTVALNLAIVLTQLDRKVLLIDADLRRPRLHKTFNLRGAAGMSNYLSGNAELADIVHETEIPNLSIIPSGPIPPNPSELLGSPRLDKLLNEFVESRGIDHLILDSPPLLSVADSIVLSARTDSTVLVVRSDSTRREALSQSAARLRHSRANVIGTVLNAVSEESGYYYRYYWYRRYYGKEHSTATPTRSKGIGRKQKAV